MDLKQLQKEYEFYKSKNLNLNIERGQPSDKNFDLSNPMLTIVTEKDVITPSGISIRNYPGGVAGLPEARELFSKILGVKPEETIVENNSCLRLISNTLMWALIKGLLHSEKPWIYYNKPKIIVTTPGYDRHFTLLAELGFEMVQVGINENGPEMDKVEEIVMMDESVKGILFVPTYSNPTGDTISDENVIRLAKMKCKAKDFTIFADDAYAIHHLTEDKKRPLNLLRACEEHGNPDRVFIFSSTSKITFSGAGVAFMGCSVENVKYITKLMGTQSIGPNKIEQYRHVKFLTNYKGGIEGLMEEHAKILRPKFEVVQEVLNDELKDLNLATWTNPKGGYFVSLNTTRPVAKRVVELAKNLGVSLTPAGATYPFGKDPNNSNIRIAPTRPSVEEVREAMKMLCLCIKLASAEYDALKNNT